MKARSISSKIILLAIAWAGIKAEAPFGHPAFGQASQVRLATEHANFAAHQLAPNVHHSQPMHPVTNTPQHPTTHPTPTPTPAHAVQHPLTTPEPAREHIPTAYHEPLIKTLYITPGGSASLEPLSLNEHEQEGYFVQDKTYEKYLSHHAHRKDNVMVYTIAIPDSLHAGSFTVFRGHGTGVHPTDLEIAYHVIIKEPMHAAYEGTQYPAPQLSSALQKLDQLEENLVNDVQAQLKKFTTDVRTVLNEASKTGESLETPITRPQSTTSLEPLTLRVGDTHMLTTFTGGSAQSNKPTIVSTLLEFTGTKAHPEWKVSLTAHAEGEALVTYATGSKIYEQPVFVKAAELTHPNASTPEEEGLRPITVSSDGTKVLGSLTVTYKINQKTGAITLPPATQVTSYRFDIPESYRGGQKDSHGGYEHLFIDQSGSGRGDITTTTYTLRTVDAPAGSFRILGFNAHGKVVPNTGFEVTVTALPQDEHHEPARQKENAHEMVEHFSMEEEEKHSEASHGEGQEDTELAEHHEDEK